jgi:hypothetical protein
MTASSSVGRLTDVIEAIESIHNEMAGVTFRTFEPERRKRWLVERRAVRPHRRSKSNTFMKI